MSEGDKVLSPCPHCHELEAEKNELRARVEELEELLRAAIAQRERHVERIRELEQEMERLKKEIPTRHDWLN